MQVELIRFYKKMSTLFKFANRVTMFTAYSLDGTTHLLTALKVNILHINKKTIIYACCLHVLINVE